MICSDKTGTLTTNMMTASRVATLAGRSEALDEFEVTGAGFAAVCDTLVTEGPEGGTGQGKYQLVQTTAG